MSDTTIKSNKLAELLARVRANNATPPSRPTVVREAVGQATATLVDNSGSITTGIGRTGEVITYNEEQQRFMQLASGNASCILIGAAGTGKTTCMRGTIETLVTSGAAGVFRDVSHKYLPSDGVPGIVAISFTRRAVANLRRAMPDDMKANCITIHKLLEYQPVYYTVFDEVTGKDKKTMKFEATRNSYNPLPSSIRTIIVDESSMVSVELFKEITDALPHPVQWIFLGDIQQLPPVFGSAILGYKMLELPTVELVQVYRQALESPIIRLAHRILSGKPIPSTELQDWKEEGKLTLHPWKKRIHAEVALLTMAKFFTAAIDSGAYNPDEDMILIPFNKACGTDELNKHVANHLARKRGAITHEVIAGFNKYYYSVGDKVLYDKEDATIVAIAQNSDYYGKRPQPASAQLDYWGFNHASRSEQASASEADITDIDHMLGKMAEVGAEEERVKVASHTITVRMNDTEVDVDIDTASAINSMLLSYALTVHKSQGSEWRKVFLVLHQSHATMIQRELLYTGVTRAKEELYVICEPDSFVKGIESQRIKGNTLAEKAEYFKGKIDNGTSSYQLTQ